MTKPRILIIIEDEFLIALELEARLKSLGYAVVRIGCHWWATGGGVSSAAIQAHTAGLDRHTVT